MTAEEQQNQAKKQIRLVLTTLAHDARMALCHDDYEEALDSAERSIVNVLLDVWRTPYPRPGHVAHAGTWEYVGAGRGHYLLKDDEGRFIGFLARLADGSWQVHMHEPSVVPPPDM